MGVLNIAIGRGSAKAGRRMLVVEIKNAVILYSSKRMLQLSEVNWRRTTGNPIQALRADYDFKDVLSYRFVRCTASNVSARVTFRVKYRTFKVRHVQIRAMVIREDKRGNPSALGQWGVNPISTLREDPVR
jgi:hypothetical protein